MLSETLHPRLYGPTAASLEISMLNALAEYSSIIKKTLNTLALNVDTISTISVLYEYDEGEKIKYNDIELVSVFSVDDLDTESFFKENGKIYTVHKTLSIDNTVYDGIGKNIWNDIDNIAYVNGLSRINGEENIMLAARILHLFKLPPNSENSHIGIARHVGMFNYVQLSDLPIKLPHDIIVQSIQPLTPETSFVYKNTTREITGSGTIGYCYGIETKKQYISTDNIITPIERMCLD